MRAFWANRGMLLSGAVAACALLSIVPLITLILMALSHRVDPRLLLESRQEHTQVVIPAQADVIAESITLFLEHRNLMSWALVVVPLFFSSMSFTVLDITMSFIFFHRVAIRRRHLLISAILPYLYILALGIGFLLITLISAAVHAMGEEQIAPFGRSGPDSDLVLSDHAAGASVTAPRAGRRHPRRSPAADHAPPDWCGISRRCRWSASSTDRCEPRSLRCSVWRWPV
jgi:uncharacterized BrkB/YihY/UPF0761 family membrane protein